jgi:hypothetical protein
VNDPLGLPSQFLIHEAVNLIVAAAVLALHWRHRSLSIFFGYFLLGVTLEMVGTMLVKSHFHGQFTFHIFAHCSLKEALYYPAFYSSAMLLAQTFRLKPVPEALLSALIVQITNIPYECIAPREGVQLIVSNPEFLFANLRATMLQGTSMQIYANLVLPTFAHLVARWCQRRRLSAVRLLPRALFVTVRSGVYDHSWLCRDRLFFAPLFATVRYLD